MVGGGKKWLIERQDKLGRFCQRAPRIGADTRFRSEARQSAAPSPLAAQSYVFCPSLRTNGWPAILETRDSWAW